MYQEDFQRILREAITETLLYFGKSIKSIVLHCCSKEFGVSEEDLPVELKKFTDCLERIFGLPALKVIELKIASTLFFKLGLDFNKVEGFRLLDYVEKARQRLGEEA